MFGLYFTSSEPRENILDYSKVFESFDKANEVAKEWIEKKSKRDYKGNHTFSNYLDEGCEFGVYNCEKLYRLNTYNSKEDIYASIVIKLEME